MKRAKKLYGLLGILAVICIATFLVMGYQEKQEKIQESGQTVLELDPDQVQALSWEYEGETLSFRKEEDTWKYEDDDAFPVNQEEIARMLERFRELGAAFIIEDVTDYGQYGLDDPICTIKMETEDQNYEITLGDYSTMDSQRYLSLGDGNVYLVADDPLEDFDAVLSEMIQNDEVPDFEEVSAISFQGEDSYQVTYQKYTEDSPYTVCEDDVYFKEDGENLLPLDTTRVESYLSSMTALDLTQYETYTAGEEDLAQYGLDSPELTVQVSYTQEDQQETFTLNLSRDPEQEPQEDEDPESITAYAQVEGSALVYKITGEEYQTLMKAGYDDLRHTQLFTADTEKITGLEITLDGESYTLTAKGEDNIFLTGEEEEELEGDDLVTALTALNLDSFTDQAADGQEEIRIKVLLDSETHPSMEIVLNRYDGENCLAQVDGQNIGLLPRSQAVDLIEAVNALVL